MTDTVTTLRPASTVAVGSWNLTGAASLDAAMRDNSDSSYGNSAAAGSLVFDMGHITLGFNDIVHLVQLRVRHQQPLTAHSLVSQIYDPVTNRVSDTSNRVAGTGSIVTSTVPGALSLDLNGDTWTQAVINRMQVTLAPLGGASLNVYEVYLDVLHNQAPTATVTAPSGTVTATSDPAITWTYADAEGDAQERYHAKVFSASQYGAGGFDPETSAATWDSGEVFSSAASVTVLHLANGTYRAYVKVADVGSGGRYGPWAYSAFTENAPVVTPPAVAAQLDQAAGRVGLTITGTDVDGDTVTVQRSADGGTTWTDITRLWTDPSTAWDFALAGTASVVVYDYESRLWGRLLYRAAATDTGPDTTSAWSVPASLTCRSPDTWLKDPLDPTANLLLCDTMNLIDTTSTEPQQVLAALGDPDYDVTGDVAKGETLALSAAFETRAEWAAFETLRRSRRKLFLSTFDEAWYVRLGPDRSTTLYPPDPISGERLRTVTVGARQVKAP